MDEHLKPEACDAKKEQYPAVFLVEIDAEKSSGYIYPKKQENTEIDTAENGLQQVKPSLITEHE